MNIEECVVRVWREAGSGLLPLINISSSRRKHWWYGKEEFSLNDTYIISLENCFLAKSNRFKIFGMLLLLSENPWR